MSEVWSNVCDECGQSQGNCQCARLESERKEARDEAVARLIAAVADFKRQHPNADVIPLSIIDAALDASGNGMAVMHESGSRFLTTGPVTIGCMSEPARDLLDIAVAEFKRQRGKDAVDENQSAYQTLYWLFRWSGVINYAALSAFDAKE